MAVPDREFIDFQGAVAGEYSLERELGRGGMGIVYLAREVQLDRHVAIKVLPTHLAAHSDIRERFEREARMAASLSHPHIVPIYRVGQAKGFVFFAMAYVDGQTLGERLRTRGPLTAAAATRMMREVAWALSYAHGRGIVHRDIKPDNILIESATGRALVTDFGIARGADETALSDPGRVMGTAHFMSPEQASNEPLDGRSDFYSLGVVGFLSVSGRLPFDAPNVPALLMKHIGSDAPGAMSVAPTITPGLAAVIDRCLRKSPSDRFASGEEVAEALDSTSTARSKIPLALRVWVQSRDPLVPLYAAWSGMFSLTLFVQIIVSAFIHGRYAADWTVIAGFALLPIVPHTLFHARKTYQALSAGYVLRDLRSALAVWRQERLEELTFGFDKVESRWARVMRGATYALVGGVAVLAVAGLTGTYVGRAILASLTGGVVVGKIIVGSIVGGAVVGISASNAFGVRLMGRRIRPRLVGAVRSWLWNSRLGEWAAKMLTPKNRKPIAELDYRPTEMALGLAASDLYAALPKAFRDDMPDLPNVVARLEAHAGGARARVEELDALIARTAHAEATTLAARDSAKRELADSVTALEAIRLDLLRVHGGAADLRPITTVLEAARELGDHLDRLANAKREADDIVSLPLSLDLRPNTPA